MNDLASVVDRVVMFSGGAASWCAAARTAVKYGSERTHLLFTDVRNEDQSTLDAVWRGAEALGCRLHYLQKGPSVWEIFYGERMLANTRSRFCTRLLKQWPARTYLDHKWGPGRAVVVLGLTWEEMHRIPGAKARYAPEYAVETPMAEEPWLFKDQIVKLSSEAGVPETDLYREGFGHSNCAGACVMAGHGHWLRLLARFPERYREMEEREQAFRGWLEKDVSIVRDRSGDGKGKPFTLRALRERHEAGQTPQMDLFEGGSGCGCFV